MKNNTKSEKFLNIFLFIFLIFLTVVSILIQTSVGDTLTMASLSNELFYLRMISLIFLVIGLILLYSVQKIQKECSQLKRFLHNPTRTLETEHQEHTCGCGEKHDEHHEHSCHCGSEHHEHHSHHEHSCGCGEEHEEVIPNLTIENPSTFLVLDLNDFKKITYHSGHRVGESLVKTFYDLVKNTSEIHTEPSFIKTYGEGSFVLFYENITSEKVVQEFLAELASVTEKYNEIEEKFQISYTSGYATNEVPTEFHDLFDKAYRAMYENKNN